MNTYPLLESIRTPQEIGQFSLHLLEELAKEVRQFLIDSVNETGGHFSSNMGTVELTVALFHTFDFLKDRIVWDVGHQAYSHKILSGRWQKFSTLRQYNGLSGFLKREESPYDHFDAGHSSTSISAALGMAMARDLQKQDFACIAVIGDGGMTAGMAFESLNQAGYLDAKQFMVVLNDNDMSINPNVGSLQGYLNHIVSGQYYHKWQDRVEKAVQAIPLNTMKRLLGRFLKEGQAVVKRIAIPGLLFEDLGFRYIGPVNGHDMKSLIKNIEEAKKQMCEGPVLLHVQTKKGYGYSPSEQNPLKWHGINPSKASSDEPKPDSLEPNKPPPPSYTSVFGNTLTELANSDEKIVGITAAMLDGTGLNIFQKAHPNRCFDVGIAEQHAVTFAAGLAVQGLRPVCAIYSTFLQRGFDQIFHDVCLQNLPVTFALDRAGLVGADGPTHHGLYDLAYLRCLPNIVLMAPKDEEEFRHMIYTAIYCDSPTAIRYPRGLGVGVPISQELIPMPIGKGELLMEGSDIVIIALGTMVQRAIDVAKNLSAEDISCAVINARFAKPIDKELICKWVKNIGRVATIEEGCLPGGFGSAIAECLVDSNIKAPLLRCGISDHIIQHGSTDLLLHNEGLSCEEIANRIKVFMANTPLKLGVTATTV
ncbi:MAG: 1-deoxy-D-xylulose-5-phosphate synthase [Holophagaceae bacterium]|nr:1-deoxy-D-xylulose-5-phosphate synthase [Holophagaceae bacterium]